MTDCLIIGYNDSSFPEYVEMVAAMGRDSGAFHDLKLAYVDYEGVPHRSMDLLNRFFRDEQGRPGPGFHNCDFLWPTITYLGTFLHRRGFTFDWVNVFQLEKERLRQKLEKGDVLSVAITTTLYVTPYPILEIIEEVRRCSPQTRIIVGGPYIHNQVKMGDYGQLGALFELIGADYYVISQQGELALTRLLAALQAGREPEDVDNLAYRRGAGYVRTAVSREANPLAENRADYRLFSQDELGEFVSLRTAVSCPFSCAFCGFPARAGKYQYNAVELVEQELNELADLGTVTTLTFLDDTFNVPKPRFKEILRMMIRNRYGFRWNSHYRSDHGDAEAIELMAESGCEGVFLGVESGSDEQLQRMNKTARRRHYLEAIPLLRRAGIHAHASFVVGFPGETEETMADTLELIETARPQSFRGLLWYCDPVTPIWERRDEFALRGSAFSWRHATMDVPTACRQVERMLETVENSVWLPQNGFEPWSLYYLQRKGMSYGRVMAFLACFRDLLREKVAWPNLSEPDPDVIEQMRRICDLRVPLESALRPAAAAA